MSVFSGCSEAAWIWIIGLIVNLLLAVLEIGNWFGGKAFSECSTRPDYFWRAFILLHMLAVAITTVVLMDPHRWLDFFPSKEFNRRLRYLPGKSFVLMEILALTVFSVMVIVAYSRCSISGVSVGFYYWSLAVLSFMMACYSTMLWVVAGHNLFPKIDSPQNLKTLSSLYWQIKTVETGKDQRLLYRTFRGMIAESNRQPQFDSLDYRMIEKYSSYTLTSKASEQEFDKMDQSCIFCIERFQIGDKIVPLRDCLHFTHFSCLLYRLNNCDLCTCFTEIANTVTEPCFPGYVKPELSELLQVQSNIVRADSSMLFAQNPDGDTQPDPNSDDSNSGDIKEGPQATGHHEKIRTPDPELQELYAQD